MCNGKLLVGDLRAQGDIPGRRALGVAVEISALRARGRGGTIILGNGSTVDDDEHRERDESGKVDLHFEGLDEQ